MSKIYEALLRAEQERAEKDRANLAATQTPAPAAQTPAAQAPPAVAQAQPAPDDVIAEIQALPAPEPVVHATPAPAVPRPIIPVLAPAIPEPVASTASPVAAPAIAKPEPQAPPPVHAAAAPAPPQTPRPIYSAPIAAAAKPVEVPSTPAPVAAVVAAPLTPVAPASFAPAAVAPASRPAPTDDRGFSPDKVRRYAWTPSFDTLPAIDDRGGPVEQFRSLRSRMFEFRDLNKTKSILISSGLPQEGKSFIAANLAISFARHKAARVLLIDGDMRRSTLHKLLGTPGETGLAEYLAGNAGLLDIMQQMEPAEEDSPASLGLASLTFIPGGSDVEKAADLSGNPRFTQLMQAVAPFYDWIVVDSPPVNVVADGVNLARACDGVLLVARSGITKYPSAQRALIELKASNILGFVLNAVETMPLTGGYYGYESYDSTQK